MAKLTAKQRNRLSPSEFAEPGKRKYPINNPSHARNALARVSQHGSPEEKKEIREKVHRKYPGIKVKSGSRKGGSYKRHWSQKKSARKRA